MKREIPVEIKVTIVTHVSASTPRKAEDEAKRQLAAGELSDLLEAAEPQVQVLE